MKKIYTTTALILLTVIAAYTQGYYVTPGGAAVLSTDINTPGSLTHAVANAMAGDTVWVKAGNYFVGNLIFQNSGTAAAPIVFIGYKDDPGDIDSTNIPNSVPAYLSGGYGGNNANFPTINGLDRTTAGLAIQLYGRHYITLKNFHITNYNHGIGTWNSSYLNFENIICAYIGNIYHSGGYNGVAISISNTSYSSARHCFVYNSAAEGINVGSSGAAPARYNVVNRCYVFCDDTTKAGLPGGPTAAATDYYFVLGSTGNYNTEYNEISDCYIERIGDVGHGGHGFAVVNYDYDSLNDVGKTRYNIIKNCTSVAIRSLFHLRGKDTEYNTFSGCTSYAGGGEPGGIAITCSKYNTFDKIETNIKSSGVPNYYFYYPIVFYKATSYSPGYQFSAVGNVFTNCLFKAPGGIGFGYYVDGTPGYSADSNRFVNCTFVNTDVANPSGFILAQRHNQGNVLENCIISGFQRYIATQSYHASSLTYQNCCFYDNGFTQSSMTGATLTNCIFQDPLFISKQTGDFRLQASSPCIDAGKPVSLTDDFDGNQRPCNDTFDIGAFEFQGNCAPATVINTITESNMGFIIYPNPANNKLFIESENIIDRVVLMDLSGRVIIEKTVNDSITQIDLSKLSEGMYLVEIVGENYNRVVKKIVKM